MHHNMRHLLPTVVLALAACGKSDTAARPDNEASSTLQVPQVTGEAATTIHLVIGDSPHAGTYDAKSPEITCTYGFAGPGTWGNQYSVTGKTPSEFSSLQLIVDAKDAADGTDEFLMTVGFGELMKEGYSEHVINTQKTSSRKQGSGTIRVDDSKTGGKVTFKGKSQDGASLEGSIDCHQMMRSEG
jgi:hypothetical protein